MWPPRQFTVFGKRARRGKMTEPRDGRDTIENEMEYESANGASKCNTAAGSRAKKSCAKYRRAEINLLGDAVPKMSYRSAVCLSV